MSLGDMKQRTEGIKKQAQELIEFAYQRGVKAGHEEMQNQMHKHWERKQKELIEHGRNEAWETARKIMSQNDASWGMKDMKEIFGLSYSTDIMLDLKASEAIDRIRAYEEKKQKEAEEIHVGDEVAFPGGTKFIVIGLSENGETFDGMYVSGGGVDIALDKSQVTKTGRHFPEIAEVLKKMQEGK